MEVRKVPLGPIKEHKKANQVLEVLGQLELIRISISSTILLRKRA